MATMEELLALANAAAEQGPDMNEAVKGGGGARLLPAGMALGRLIEVVELGNHAQEFQGKAKDPALEVQLGFALWGEARDMAGNLVGTYHEADGTPSIVRPYSFAVSRNEKARAYLLFKALNWKGTAKSFAQLLGQTFLVKIVHEAKSKTDATLVSRIDLKGFLPPLDPLSRQPYPIPDVPLSEYRLFLWSHPTKEGWDSLHIEGQYDDGKSKNFVQEKILNATDFMGSPLQQLLFNAGVTALPTAPAKAPAQAAAPAALPPGAGYAPAFTPPVTAAPGGSFAPAAPATPPNVTASAPSAGGVGSVPLTPPAIAAVPSVAVAVAPAGPVAPIAPTSAVTPIAPAISPSSPVAP